MNYSLRKHCSCVRKHKLRKKIYTSNLQQKSINKEPTQTTKSHKQQTQPANRQLSRHLSGPSRIHLSLWSFVQFVLTANDQPRSNVTSINCWNLKWKTSFGDLVIFFFRPEIWYPFGSIVNAKPNLHEPDKESQHVAVIGPCQSWQRHPEVQCDQRGKTGRTSPSLSCLRANCYTARNQRIATEMAR